MKTLKKEFDGFFYKYEYTGAPQADIHLVGNTTENLWNWLVKKVIPVEKRVSPKTADDSNKIRWFMELALKMRETGYSDALIYSIDTDAWDEYRVDDELTPEQAITEEESNG